MDAKVGSYYRLISMLSHLLVGYMVGANFDFNGVIGYNYGSGTGAFNANAGGNYTFVPAPGALALLGLSGLCLRRRRA